MMICHLYNFYVLNLGVKIRAGYCIIGYHTTSFLACENIGQSDNSKVALIGSKVECMP